MIADECFSGEWQTRKREELGGCDPVLLEKTIHAFALLDALAGRGLDFVFKGGTSLLLRLPRIRRLSIDADIFCHEPPEKLDALLAEVSRMRPFTGMTEDDRGAHRVPSRRHFKFSYTPLDAKNPAPFVLLDVVHERNVYPHVERVPLRTAFVEGDGALLVPTVEGLLGDKLTAFGPNTTDVTFPADYAALGKLKACPKRCGSGPSRCDCAGGNNQTAGRGCEPRPYAPSTWSRCDVKKISECTPRARFVLHKNAGPAEAGPKLLPRMADELQPMKEKLPGFASLILQRLPKMRPARVRRGLFSSRPRRGSCGGFAA